MVCASTSLLEGYASKEHLGLIAGEAIMGANFLEDLSSGNRDLVGGRSGSLEKVVSSAHC